MTKVLDGRVALVTGASRGIGAAAAIELARLGAHVVITARTQGGLEDTDDAIRAAGGTATLLPLDLAEGEQIDAIGPSLFAAVRPAGRAGACGRRAGRLTPVGHILPKDWADVVAVNLRGDMAADPHLRPAAAPAPRPGRAVFVTDARARRAAGLLGRLWGDQGGAWSIWC